MAFEGLSDKLESAFKKLKSKGSLTESDVREAMREVRLALLEADVSYKVVKDFIARVSERAVGADVLESLTPAQMVIKIVNDELTALMGGSRAKIQIISPVSAAGKMSFMIRTAAYKAPAASRNTVPMMLMAEK